MTTEPDVDVVEHKRRRPAGTGPRAAHHGLLASLRNRPCVIVESPYRGATEVPMNVARNRDYACAAVGDALARGEAPFASHLFYTQFLDDSHEASRRTGMMCGWAWLSRATLVAVYLDLGWSDGMREGVALARSMKIRVEERAVPGWRPPAPDPYTPKPEEIDWLLPPEGRP
jgi:hypothetical protein